MQYPCCDRHQPWLQGQTSAPPIQSKQMPKTKKQTRPEGASAPSFGTSPDSRLPPCVSTTLKLNLLPGRVYYGPFASPVGPLLLGQWLAAASAHGASGEGLMKGPTWLVFTRCLQTYNLIGKLFFLLPLISFLA